MSSDENHVKRFTPNARIGGLGVAMLVLAVLWTSILRRRLAGLPDEWVLEWKPPGIVQAFGTLGLILIFVSVIWGCARAVGRWFPK